MKTILTAVALALAVTTFAPVIAPLAGDTAEAQPAADRRTQPGNSSCRLRDGSRC
jgi:hypothetical protein